MFRAFAYLRYLWKAQGIHKAHSPFIFSLFNEVLNRNKHFYVFDHIEAQRRLLSKDHGLISVEDHGAGSNRLKGNVRRISSIANSSLKRPKYAQCLFRLCDHLHAKQVLELGTSLGLTTAYLAAATEEVTSVEGAPEIAHIARNQLKQLDLHATVVNAVFAEVLPELQTKEYDVIFIDGHHKGEALLSYAEALIPTLTENGVLVVDDINWSSDMQTAWQQLAQRQEFELAVDLFEMGILFKRKGMQKQYQVLRY